jgi:hypothetical protein
LRQRYHIITLKFQSSLAPLALVQSLEHPTMRSLVVVAALLWSVATAFAADPSGTYDVQGTSPDGSKYSGTVTITETGQTFKMVWKIGSDTYTGTAIGNKDFLAVSYTSGSDTGLALYGAEGGNWKGIWTYAGGTKMGSELLNRQ